MNAQVKFAYYALAFVLTSTMLVADEDNATTRVHFESALGSGLPIDPQRLWSDIVRSDFELSSLPDHRHGYFEFCGFVAHEGQLPDGQKRAELARVIADHDDGWRIALLPDDENLPGWIWCNNQFMRVNAAGDWGTEEGTWAAAFDENHVDDFSHSKGIPSKEGGFIKFSLGPFLGALGINPSSTQWHGGVRALVVTTAKGSTATIRFRTPNDQRRFGTLLGELALHSTANMSFRCFIVDRASPLRLNIGDIDSLPRRLGAVQTVTANGTKFKYAPLDTDARRLAAARVYSEVGALPLDDPLGIPTPGAPSRFEQSVSAHIAIDKTGLLKRNLKSGKYGNADDYVASLSKELEIGYWFIERAITRGTADRLVDDPNILWLGLERALHPRTAGLLFLNTVWSSILSSSGITTDAKVSLCMAIGEFGPPSLIVMAPPLSGRNGPFLEAILHARWNWVPTDEELALCRGKLDNPFASELEREAAIDSLVRWGKLGDVPGEKLDEWFQRKLAASGTQRHCTWKALTRTESGRRFLTGRLESLASTPDIRKDVAKIFCARAEATLEMKRFDFMSEAECRQTLDVCRPLAE